MSDFIVGHYNLWRGLHIIAVIAWMAGIMYLPRLYSYHVKAGAGSEVAKLYFEGMEEKLLRIIMTPAMILAFIFGGMLLYVDGTVRGPETFHEPWMIAKLAGVLFMAGWHGFLAKSRKKIAAGTDTHSEKFWRATNELPFIAAIIMVIAVTTEFGAG